MKIFITAVTRLELVALTYGVEITKMVNKNSSFLSLLLQGWNTFDPPVFYVMRIRANFFESTKNKSGFYKF